MTIILKVDDVFVNCNRRFGGNDRTGRYLEYKIGRGIVVIN